jgi:hypothetical protein
VIDALMTTARVLPEALAFRLFPMLESTETPTAKLPDRSSSGSHRIPLVGRQSSEVLPSVEAAPAAESGTGSRSFTVPQLRSRSAPWLTVTAVLCAIAAVLFLLGR